MFADLERAPNIEYIDTPAEIRQRYQYVTEAKMARLRTASCGRAFLSLEDAVGRYVREFLATAEPTRRSAQK